MNNDYRLRIRIINEMWAVKNQMETNRIYPVSHFDDEFFYVTDGDVMVEVPFKEAQQVDMNQRRVING